MTIPIQTDIFNFMKRIFILSLLLAGIGCGRAPEPTPEIKRLTVWTVGSEGNKISQIAQDFQKTHPEIILNIVKLDWEVARDQILSAISEGNTPDLCQVGTTWMAEFAETGTLAPLDDFVFQSRVISKEKFFSGSWQTNVIGGTLYGIPWYFEIRLLFYRKDLLEKKNFTHPPRDWEELERIASATTTDENGDGAPDTYGLGLSYFDAKTVVPFVWQNSGSMLNSDFSATLLCGEKEREALQFYVNLFRKGLVLPRGQNPAIGFAQGKCAMTIAGPWYITILNKEMPGKESLWGVAPLPRKQFYTSFYGGSNFVIFNSCKNKEAAFQFLEYLSLPEIQSLWFRPVSALPAVKAAWEEPAPFAPKEYREIFESQLKDVKTFPAVPQIEVITNTLEKTILESTESTEPLDPLLDRLCEEINSLLK